MKKSNMYDGVKTWNPLAGECPHGCAYCYVNSLKKRSPALKAKYSGVLRLDEKALKKNLGEGNTWFVCSCNDLFAKGNPVEFWENIVSKTFEYHKNDYIWHTKNPAGFSIFCRHKIHSWKNHFFYCTIESNRDYINEVDCIAPSPIKRLGTMANLDLPNKVIAIEPIMDFDIIPFVEAIKKVQPIKVLIGADSKNCHLPEPSPDKINALIDKLSEFTNVITKSNLSRLLK